MMMKKKFFAAAAVAASLALAAPAFAAGFTFSGGVGSGFVGGANANSGGWTSSTGGTILGRNSWSKTETGSQGDIAFSVGSSTPGGIAGNFAVESYGIAANGNSIRTNGPGTSSGSSSSSAGSFQGTGSLHFSVH